MRYEFEGKQPQVHETVWEAPNAMLIGDIVIGAYSSIWHGVILRGDAGQIRIGEGTNIQEYSQLHANTILGDRCTIGHNAVVHGCTVGNGVLIGISSVVLDRAVIGDGAVIAAGAVVAPDTVVPPGALMMGVPAKEVRRVSEEEIALRVMGRVGQTQAYIDLAQKYMSSALRPIR